MRWWLITSGKKYWVKHADHLINAIQDHYQVSTYLEGQRYCRIRIKWNYQKQVVYLPMTGYIQEVLHRFQHSQPTRKEHAPHIWEKPNYAATQKLTKAEDILATPPAHKIY